MESMERNSFSWKRLVFFVCIHLVAFLAEIVGVVIFLYTQQYLFAISLLVPIVISGLFCSYSAWNCEMPRTGSKLFPLKDRHLIISCLLILPMGFLQGVIVWMAFEEYFEANSSCSSSETTIRPLTDPEELLCPQRPAIAPNKCHCKAVNGLFEGITSTMVLLYAFWSLGVKIGNPPEPITPMKFQGEGVLIGTLGIICFLSTGLGLVELDYCTSSAIAKRMNSSISAYEIIHWLFRTCEVASRVCMFVSFMVLTRASTRFELWWCILLADFGLTVFFVTILGGAETSSRGWFVRILCSMPCVFANIFAFIDAPSKCRAANLVFRCLTFKHAAEQVFLPLVLYCGIGDHLWITLNEDWKKHCFMIVIALCASVLYWLLLVYVSLKSFHDIRDIFSACFEGSVIEVQKAIRDAAISLNVNHPNVDGLTPLMIAAYKGHSDVCQLLIRHGARVEMRRCDDNRICRAFVMDSLRYQWTALHMAAKCGHLEVVKIMIKSLERRRREAGATDAEEVAFWISPFQDSMQRTPLHIAAERGHVEVCGYLADHVPLWKEAMQSHLLDQFEGRERKSQESIELAQILPTWQEVEVPIARNNHLMAPGLCSYIVSCCGGALGYALIFHVSPSEPLTSENANNEGIDFFGGRSCDGSDPKFEALEIGDCLRQGAFSEVWRAQHQVTKKPYVVKISKPTAEAKGKVYWMRREFELADRVSLKPHPCLVRLFSARYGVDGRFHLVMEFCPGGDLEHVIQKLRSSPRNYVPPVACVAWIGQIFLGLEHMHRRMHTLLRDLKPENVVLSSNVAKLTDFCCGRFGAQSAHDRVGTPGYWAPEVVWGEDCDFRSDLFSLGVLAWVLLSGGLLKKSFPTPPFNLADFRNDYRELQRCLEDPESNAALRLPDLQQDFVASLIKRSPEARLDHDAIREHLFLQALDPKLPRFEDNSEKVQLWLDRISASDNVIKPLVW